LAEAARHVSVVARCYYQRKCTLLCLCLWRWFLGASLYRMFNCSLCRIIWVIIITDWRVECGTSVVTQCCEDRK